MGDLTARVHSVLNLRRRGIKKRSQRRGLTDFDPLYEVAARQLWLTARVLLEGILWCAALDRMRDAVRLLPLTWGMDGRTLVS